MFWFSGSEMPKRYSCYLGLHKVRKKINRNSMDKVVFDFLHQLDKNNNRDWFIENKEFYTKAQKEIEKFVDRLIPNILKFDPRIGTLTAKQTMFRIYRDVRFSKDKTPYKTYFGAFIAPGGRKSEYAGYYMHLAADTSFLGGGSHNPSGENLKKIRSEIYYNSDEFKKIISQKNFKETFGEMEGEKLVRPPVGYPKDFADIELLKFKTFTVFQNITEKQVTETAFDKYTLEVFKTMKPFIEFLNRGLAD
jgi:uncharacterized protein (TIGR02453 family)